MKGGGEEGEGGGGNIQLQCVFFFFFVKFYPGQLKQRKPQSAFESEYLQTHPTHVQYVSH